VRCSSETRLAYSGLADEQQCLLHSTAAAQLHERVIEQSSLRFAPHQRQHGRHDRRRLGCGGSFAHRIDAHGGTHARGRTSERTGERLG